MSTLAAPVTKRAPGLGLIGRAPGWVVLGAAGSVLLTLAGARLSGGAVRWWFHPEIPPGGHANTVALYIGMAMLSAAWLGLGRQASSGSCTTRELAAVGALWCLPLALGAPLFSHDVYSYLAQGTIAHLGRSPYHDAPVVLGHLGHPQVLNAVDRFWRRETAPYGPLFLVVVGWIAGATGSHLVAGALLIRLVELGGLLLLWVFLPRLARTLGADPSRAAWLVLLSPLVLLQLVAASHNDLLMVGLMVAGVTFAAERRPLLGIAICALAMTVKLPAAVAIVFIAVAWVRARPSWSGRARAAAEAIVVVAATIGAVSAVTGWGLHWISGSLFSTPARVRLAITPATGVAWTLQSLLHDAGATVRFVDIESVTRVIAAVLAAAFAIVLLVRTRWENLVRMLGLALIAIAFGGPAAWPWYFAWGAVLLAATTPLQLSRAFAAALVVGAFVVGADGILVLPLRSAPYVVGLYLAIAGAAWYTWRRRRHRPRPLERADARTPASHSALARSSSG